MAERRVAGPEVVDRDAHAHRAQGAEDPGGVARIAHRRGLRDLQLERVRIEAGGAQRPPHRLDQRLVVQLAGADVHAHQQRPAEPAVPGPSLPARLVEDAGADPDQDPAVLSGGDELERLYDAALRMPPADQRLHGDDLLAGDGDHRLVLEEELVVLERPFELGLEGQPVGALGVHARVEEQPAVAALARGQRHGRAGVAQKLRGRHPVAGVDGDPHARGQEELVRADRQSASRVAARTAPTAAPASAGPAAPGSSAANVPSPR